MTEQKHDRIFVRSAGTWKNKPVLLASLERIFLEDDVEYISKELHEQQLAEATKQNVMLREAVLAVCCDPEGTVCIRGSDGDREVIQEALDATDDLAGLILCDAEPAAWDYEGVELWFHATSDEQRASTPLYKARKP